MIPGMSNVAPNHPPYRFPIEAADLCVKCGMCLPHCPTYGATLDESESPRGRIMLMQGLATGRLAPSPVVEQHLDACLACRACEAVCPADVPYGRLIDSVREGLAQGRPARTRVAKLMAAVLINKPLRWAAAALLWVYQRSGIQWLLRRSRILGRGSLNRLESLLPRIHLPRAPVTGATDGTGGRVALFTNCTSPLSEPLALQSAVRMLEALRCEVTIPAGQTCCGALHQHAGLPEPARRCAEANLRAFSDAPTVIGIASGCTAQLIEYDALLPDKDGAAFAKKSADIHGFLAAHPALADLRFRPLAAHVLLHTPCTMRNVLKDAAAVRQLLERIPGLRITAMDPACCGAAGSYFLTQPDMADRLLEPKLEHIAREQPAYVLSSNVGCSMHLAAGLRRAGITAPVWHPLQLLAQQLDD